MSARASSREAYRRRWHRAILSVEKELSITALSQTLPERLMLHAMLTFPDALRADPVRVAAYAAEKQRVAELVDWDNKTAYSIEKGPCVLEVLASRR